MDEFYWPVFSLIVMAANYRTSNKFAVRQIRVLLLGIGMGVIFYILRPHPHMFSWENRKTMGRRQNI
jgi:hypothetical protein